MALSSESLAVGVSTTLTRTIGDADIALFALVTGDTHPLHIDTVFASQTPYGQRIVPHALLTGMIEAHCAASLPGIACLARTVTLTLHTFAYLDDPLEFIVTVTDLTATTLTCSIVIARMGNQIADGTISFLRDSRLLDYQPEDL